MRIPALYPILGVALLAGSQTGLAQYGAPMMMSAPADGASVTITSPADGAMLDAMAQNKVVYEVVSGPKGDHVHLYVDRKEAAILRQLKGSHALATLPPGRHDICVRVVDKGHTPIGVEQCVRVNVN